MKAKLDITDELNLIKKDLVKVLLDSNDLEKYNAIKLVIEFIQENRDSLDFEELLQALRITYYKINIRLTDKLNYVVYNEVFESEEFISPRTALYDFIDKIADSLF